MYIRWKIGAWFSKTNRTISLFFHTEIEHTFPWNLELAELKTNLEVGIRQRKFFHFQLGNAVILERTPRFLDTMHHNAWPSYPWIRPFIIIINVLTNTRVLSIYNWETKTFLRDFLHFWKPRIASRLHGWNLWMNDNTEYSFFWKKKDFKWKKKKKTKGNCWLLVSSMAHEIIFFLGLRIDFLFFFSSAFILFRPWGWKSTTQRVS